MNTEEGNKIIHDWMGNKRMKPPFQNEWIGQQKVEDLKYHSSFDWLMPVVQKIKNMENDPKEMFMGTTLERHIEFSNVTQMPICTSIDFVFKAIIKFITWYNSLQQSKQTGNE